MVLFLFVKCFYNGLMSYTCWKKNNYGVLYFVGLCIQMDGDGIARRDFMRNACRWKVYVPEDQSKAIGEHMVAFKGDVGCLVRHAAPNWGNQMWKDIPTNEKDALFKKLEVDL